MNENQHMAKRKYFGKLAANSYVPFVPFHMSVFEQSVPLMVRFWVGLRLKLNDTFFKKSMFYTKLLI